MINSVLLRIACYLMECLLHDVKLSRCCIMFASACMLLHHSFGALTL
jgi:hypothetical protein